MAKWRYFFQKRNPAITNERVLHEQRQRFNPLRGFDPDRLVYAIDAFRVGSIDPLSRIIEELEERDDMMTSCARKNRASLGRCPHQVLITEGYEGDERAERHKQILTRFWANVEVTSTFTRNERGGIRLLKQQMANAISRRFAVHEIVWQPLPDGEITARFVQVPNWFFENRTGELRFLRAPGMLDGVPMAAGEWLVTVGDGIGIAAAVLAMSKTLSRNDWLLFTERCGQPGLHVATDAAEGSDPWQRLVRAVRNFGREWSIVTDNSTKLNPIDLKTGSTLPYEPLISLCNKGIATLYRGADLSTISGKDGESTGASVQGKETDLLEQDACEMLSETLNYQIERYVIRYVTGDTVPLAYLSIAPTEQPNVDQDIKIDEHLANHGVELSRNDALARYGRTAYDAETEGDAPLKPRENPQMAGFGSYGLTNDSRAGATPLQNVANALQNSSNGNNALERMESVAALLEAQSARKSDADLDALLEAFRADMGPVAERVAALLEMPHAERAAAAGALAAELPSLVPDDPEMTAVLASAIADAFVGKVAGLENQKRGKTTPGSNTGSFAPDAGGAKAGGARPRESKTKGSRDNHGTTDTATMTRSPEANMKRGRSVLTSIMGKGSGSVQKAMYREDTGWVGMAYGRPGKASNDYAGGYGLSHIAAKHPDAVALIPEIVQQGKAYKHDKSRRKLYLLHKDRVVVLTKDLKSRAIVTGYTRLTAAEQRRIAALSRYRVRGEN